MAVRIRCVSAYALVFSLSLTCTQAFAQATDVACDKCVDQTDIAQQAVTTGKLATGAVTGARLADKAVTSAKIAGGSVTQGKIRDEAVTTPKIRAGAVTAAKASPELSNALATYCPPGQIVIGHDGDGNLACEPPSRAPASCATLEYDGTVWGRTAAGLDLRQRTASTLHFIGCNDNGCEVDSFYCNYDAEAGTLAFGSTSEGSALRVLIDPDNAARGDILGDDEIGCCSAEFPDRFCNAPIIQADATALCNALGYTLGTLVRTTTGNSCPKASAGEGDDGADWGSNFIFVDGSGMEYLCSN